MIQRSRRFFDFFLSLNALVCLLLLYLPISTLVVYSFNDGQGSLVWHGATLKWFESLFFNKAIMGALTRSISLGLTTALIATVLGSMMALGMKSLKGRWRRHLDFFLLLPMLVPEIVAAVGLLIVVTRFYRPFLSLMGLSEYAIIPVVAGHLSFALAYVVVVVNARLQHLDPALEDAAQNLGASRFEILRLVILPQLRPAIICAFVLVFTLSLDDFYLSHFLSYGGNGFTTLPVYLFGLQSRSALTPEMNAIASLMILMSLVMVSVFALIFRRIVSLNASARGPSSGA